MYDIKVSNPRHVSQGVDSIIINGNRIKGNILPLAKAGTTNVLEVTMGGQMKP